MFQMYYTAGVLLLLFLMLAKEFFKPAVVIFAALLLLVIGNVISIDEAFIGFANKGMITVAFLFIVSAALQASGLFQNAIRRLLGNTKTGKRARYIRLLFPVAGFSAFLNNTPIVASLIPIIKNWTKRNGLSSSKFLIPLSYAAILGGTCTLIGTSTNLIIHGMLLDKGLPGLSFFEITQIGLPVTLITLVFLALMGDTLLPDRKEVVTQLGESTREFVVEMKVGSEYPHTGKTIEQANLRHLQGLFLFQVSREGQVIAPVAPHEKIQKGDRLFFTGIPETIYELQKTPGLLSIKDSEFDIKNVDSDSLRTYEAVVSNTSPLIGQTVRDSQFRDRYNGVILAIHRSGSRVNKKVGDIVFKPTDTLFILAKKGFDEKWYHSKDFSLVSSSVEVYSKPQWKGNLALILLLLMVGVAALNILPIILAAGITAILMIFLGIVNTSDAKKAVSWDVLLYIASSFGIAKALENSGLAEVMANGLVQALHQFGPIGIIAGLFFATTMFTWVVTNNAVAAIMFPVTLSIASMMHLDPRPFLLTLAVAASASFATPIGYQTNLMVYGPGGYRFKDFLKIGVPVSLLVGVIAVTTIYFLYFN